jgi:hypothetical protein
MIAIAGTLLLDLPAWVRPKVGMLSIVAVLLAYRQFYRPAAWRSRFVMLIIATLCLAWITHLFATRAAGKMTPVGPLQWAGLTMLLAVPLAYPTWQLANRWQELIRDGRKTAALYFRL